MRLLVCGGRDFTDNALLCGSLDAVHGEFGVTVMIEGDARGADRLAGSWASNHDIPVMAFPVNWKRDGLRAGPLRNQQMLDEGRPDLVVAFPTGGPGTADMIRRAKRQGFAVRVIPATKAP